MSILSIDQKIATWFLQLFNSNGWGVVLLALVSLVVTVLCAGVIGFEREYHGHSAGLRTHLLVAIGSCLVMTLSIYGFGVTGAVGTVSDYAGGTTGIVWQRDPARLAAQVVSGIGFLGAGTIIQNGSDVKGLTTATTLWLVMALGLAAGSGNFIICVGTTVIAFFVLKVMRKLEKVASKHNPVVIMVLKDKGPGMSDVLQIASKFGVSLRNTDVSLVSRNGEKAMRVSMSLVYASKPVIEMFINEVRENIKPLEIKVTTEIN